MMYHSPRITECPHCSTAFRVSDAQLRAAKGAVRCGSCLEVFLAHQHWLHDDQYDDFDDWQDEDPTIMLAELEQLDRELENSLDNEDWALQLLEEELNASSNHATNTEENSSPSFVVLDDDDHTDEQSETLTQEGDSAITSSQEDDVSISSQDTESNQNESPIELGLFADQRTEKPIDAAEALDDDNPFKPQPIRKKNSLIEWFSALIIFAALIALAGQYIYFNSTQLSRDVKWRELIENVCPILTCTVSEWADINAIHSEIVVRGHAQEKNALLINVRLLNTSPLPQAFPQIKLSFSDINGIDVGSRSFKPEEYLAGEIANLKEMPVQQAIQIELAIVDPGTQAVNYKITLHK